MTPLLLVHGGGHSANCWDELIPRLDEMGIETINFDLTGHGDKRGFGFKSSMSHYARDIVKEASNAGTPVIALAHSIGGYSLTLAANNNPGLFKKLIFLNAYLPKQNGSTVFGDAMRYLNKMEASTPIVSLASGTIRADKTLSAELFYSEYDGDRYALATRNLCPQPLRPLFSRVKWKPARLKTIPKVYIECGLDRTLPLDVQREMQKRMDLNKVISFAGDHSPFTSSPEGFARTLGELVRQD